MESVSNDIKRALLNDGLLIEIRHLKFDPIKAALFTNLLKDVQNNRYNKIESSDILLQIWDLPLFFHAYRDRCVTSGANSRDYNIFLRELNEVVGNIVKRIAEDWRSDTGGGNE